MWVIIMINLQTGRHGKTFNKPCSFNDELPRKLGPVRLTGSDNESSINSI